MMGGDGPHAGDAGRDPQRELHGASGSSRTSRSLYRGKNGRVAHECILDCGRFKKTRGIEVEDIAKRLMDYGFHAPTMSFPVAGTLMVEPTESESKAELDRFCDAMIAIREEIRAIEDGHADRARTTRSRTRRTPPQASCADEWNHPYSPRAGRLPRPVDARPQVLARRRPHRTTRYGDRNLVCTCPDISEYA